MEFMANFFQSQNRLWEHILPHFSPRTEVPAKIMKLNKNFILVGFYELYLLGDYWLLRITVDNFFEGCTVSAGCLSHGVAGCFSSLHLQCNLLGLPESSNTSAMAWNGLESQCGRVRPVLAGATCCFVLYCGPGRESGWVGRKAIERRYFNTQHRHQRLAIREWWWMMDIGGYMWIFNSYPRWWKPQVDDLPVPLGPTSAHWNLGGWGFGMSTWGLNILLNNSSTYGSEVVIRIAR